MNRMLRVPQWMGLVCLCLMPIATAGCGLVLVHGPRASGAQTADVTCTESKVMPSLDILGAALGVGLAAVGAPSQGFNARWASPG
jgi:hypothetical protein